MNKIKPFEIIKIGFILFLITAIAALLLAFVNQKTAPIIKQNSMAKTQAAMKNIMPDASEFIKTEYNADGVYETYIALDSSKKLVGACIISTSNGYGGEIKVLSGIKNDGTISGIDILSHSETPGLGANATKSEFKNQYQNKCGKIDVVKTNATDNQINAMSGATITSKAVTDAVNIGSMAANELINSYKED